MVLHQHGLPSLLPSSWVFVSTFFVTSSISNSTSWFSCSRTLPKGLLFLSLSNCASCFLHLCFLLETNKPLLLGKMSDLKQWKEMPNVVMIFLKGVGGIVRFCLTPFSISQHREETFARYAWRKLALLPSRTIQRRISKDEGSLPWSKKLMEDNSESFDDDCQRNRLLLFRGWWTCETSEKMLATRTLETSFVKRYSVRCCMKFFGIFRVRTLRLVIQCHYSTVCWRPMDEVNTDFDDRGLEILGECCHRRS